MDKLFVFKVTYINNASIINTQFFSIWATGAKLARMSLNQRLKNCAYQKLKIERLASVK